MAKKREPRGRRGAEGSTGTEWVGGIVSMPAYVTGEGDPYRPEMLLWMGAQGAILGSTLARPGEVLGMACESLQSTIEHPMFGAPHAPTRVRVASSALAEALRHGHPKIGVVCGPTPELDEVTALMQEQLADSAAGESSYYVPPIEPDACAAFFRAAAGLFRVEPWKVVPSDQDLFSLDIEDLGIQDAALSIIGQMGQSRGAILFAGVDDFEAFVDAAQRIERGELPEMPPHLDLNFDRLEGVPEALQREIQEHDWEVAGEHAVPWLVAVDEEMVPRPPTVREVTVGEAIALALPTMLREKKALRAAWEKGDPVSRTVSVRTHAGEIDVTLRAPCERGSAQHRPSHEVLADLFDLTQDEDLIEPEARGPLEDEIVRRFADSHEAEGLSDLQACRFVMDYAADYFGATIATLGPSDLREIIFDIIPRKVSIDPSEACWIVEVNRAFYGFLKREFELAQADACLRVLGGDAVQELEAALSDSRNFGMAKSFVMAGQEAGFEMDTKEGLEAWLEVARGMPLPPGVDGPALGGPAIGGPQPGAPETARRAKKAKKKRKAARKARKRNR